jgi:hypothetical protein
MIVLVAEVLAISRFNNRATTEKKDAVTLFDSFGYELIQVRLR